MKNQVIKKGFTLHKLSIKADDLNVYYTGMLKKKVIVNLLSM